jgi:tetratricopeptide (TPR) repeat protein
MLAHLFSQQERWNDSTETAREGLCLDPDNVLCAKSLARALIHMNRLGEAQEILKVVMAKDPEEEWTHTIQGLLYHKQNKLEASLHHFQEAARINPENTNAHKAIKQLQEQLQKHPFTWAALLPLLYFVIKLIVYLLAKN